MLTPEQKDMEKIVSLCKRRGFVFQSSEIYGGLGSTWDYGPLGVELKNNVKQAWWRAVVYGRDDVVGLDSAILMHPRVWEASGHVENFADPLVECKACNHRFRADNILFGLGKTQSGAIITVFRDGATRHEVELALAEKAKQVGSQLTGVEVRPLLDQGQLTAGPITSIPCPACEMRTLTEPRMFNLMAKTFLGPVEDTAHAVYLRPETAQGIFVNFQNVLTVTRKRLPLGIAQIGKSFRNEITPGNFVFRTREFEQMECEFFVKPGTDEEWHQRWVQERFAWYKRLGIREENLRLRQHGKDELAHYAKACDDVEYHFPWGWAELEGIANRTDFDLKRHAEFSGKDLSYFDDESKERFYPYVIEPSGGVDRSALAFLVDAYDEEPDPGAKETRTVLRFHRDIAPVKVAVLPLSRNERLVPTAREVYALVRPHFPAMYDDAQSIGRRYRRQDEIGTPFCVTIDFESLEDKQVTIRDRDSMKQVRVPIAELVDRLKDMLEKGW